MDVSLSLVRARAPGVRAWAFLESRCRCNVGGPGAQEAAGVAISLSASLCLSLCVRSDRRRGVLQAVRGKRAVGSEAERKRGVLTGPLRWQLF